MFGKKADMHYPACDVCKQSNGSVRESSFGYLCQRCIERAIYVAAFSAAGKEAPKVSLPPPPPPRLTMPDPGR